MLAMSDQPPTDLRFLSYRALLSHRALARRRTCRNPGGAASLVARIDAELERRRRAKLARATPLLDALDTPPSQTPSSDADASLRLRWRHLVEDVLPEAAPRRDWPVDQDHCFARIMLDCVLGCRWERMIAKPAWRHLSTDQLRRAIALAESVLAGGHDLHALNKRSLTLRQTSSPETAPPETL